MLVNLIGLVMMTALLCPSAGWRQDPEIKSETKSEQKAALIKELLTQMKFEEKLERLTENLKDNPLRKSERTFEMIWKTYPQNPEFNQLNAKQQEALKKQIEESLAGIEDRINKEMELQKQKARIANVEELLYTAYGKLTENELKELIAFFSSSSGRLVTETELGRPTPQPTKAELDKMASFIKSPAYKRSVEAAFLVIRELMESAKKELKSIQEVARQAADEELKLFLQKQQ